MGKMTADELRRAGEAYRSENNGAQKSPVTVSANTEGSGKKMTASELRQAGEAYRKANGLSDPIYMESPATVVDKYSAPSTQPTQAAPAGASSRKQSDAMKQNVDTLKKQRDDALIKAGAYHRAGMKQEEAEQLGIASRIYADSVNAETKYKTQKNIEATEDYDPSKNKFKAGTATLASLQDFGQSFMQGAGVLSHYLGDGEAAYRQAATSAKNLMDKGVAPKEAFETAGLVKKDAAPITDYKTVAELKREKDRASVGTLEGIGLDTAGALAGMAIPAAVTAITKSPAAGLSLMSVSSLGHKYADAYEKYGNGDLAFVLGLGAGAATYTTEQIGGVFGRLGGTKLGQAATKKLMSEAPGIYALANSTGGKWLLDALSEGVEEGAEDLVNYAVEKSLTGESDEMDNIGYDMLLGALAGGAMGGANAAVRYTAYNRTGKALNASPEAVAQQVQEGLEKGAGTAPAIYAAEVQKNPSNQMVGRLFEANRTFDRESGLSKIQGDITQISAKEIKAMVSDAQALAQAAQKLNVEATPQAVATAIIEAQRTESIKTAEDSVGQAFAPKVDNPTNAGEEAYNSALAGVAANQGIAGRINNDPAAKETFSRLTGVQFTGNTAQDIAAIEVATRNIAKSGKQAVSQAEYAQRVAAAGEQAAAQFDANMQEQAEQMQRESEERWLSVEQNTITDVDGKRHIKEITNTDVRGNTEIGYKKAEITKLKKKAVDAVNNAAKYLGKTIVWYEGALQVNGQYRLANGFRAPDGTIYVNINSRDPLMVTFGHEMFHDLVADGKYSGLIDTLVENPDYADMVNGMMNAKTELYERNGIELDPNAAAEEVAADISGELLDSRDMLEYIGARNAEAATGIKGFLNRILKKLKGKPYAQEAYNRLSEAQKALLDGMEGRTGDVTAETDARYSIYESYADDISQWVRDGKPNGMVFVLGNTGPVLQGLGAVESDIYLTSDKLNVIQKDHPEVSNSTIKKIPQILEDPILILRSKGHGKSGSNSRMVVIGAVKADNGQPLLTILDLRPYEKGFLVDDMQKVNSAYTKKNPENFIRGSEIVYADKNRTVPLLRRIGLTIASRELQQSGSIGSITYNGNGVNISGVPFSDIVSTNNYSMQNSAEDASGKYSLMDIPAMDSTGRELSAEQREYFKDSKVRDDDGNLLVVYHGTDADFTVFDASKGRANMDIQGMFFSPWELDAQGYGKNVSAYYLNITNPASEALGYKALNMFKGENNAGVKAREYLQSLGYDGVNNGDEEYIAFSPEQIKLVDNTSPTESKDIRYSLMEDAQYMADIDKAVAEATAKSEEALKAAQAEVKELRQQLLDYRQQADAEAKMNDRWRDAETKLVADLAAAKEREKAAKARTEFMAKYDALAKQYRADLRANNQQAQEKYNEKLTEAKDEFNRRRTQDRIDRVVREDQAKSKARLRAAEQKSTTTDDVAKVLTEMPKKDKETFKAKAAKDWHTFKRQWINTKDELERFGNEVGDSRIMYAANNVGQASAAAQYSIGGAGQYDLNGKKIGDKNLMQVFEPAKKAGLTDEFYTYLLHEHNVDRMSVREKAQRQLAELREKLNREVKGFAEMTDENIATAAGKDTTLTKAYTEEQIAAAKQYKQFQAWAEKQFDKPVFGSSVTAADSRAAADKLLKEHPEFEKWAKDVYAYLDGLMEVRKQGGLVSEDMVQRMKELYPHYVPTYRDMPSTSGGYSNPNSVAVNSTIKSAKGGNQDIMPLIDSIARQTLQTFSAAKKNILGNMLYEDAMDTTRDISEYIQSVTEEGDLVDLDADSAENLNNTLRIWVDGKPVTLHMSEAMADGFRPIEQSNSFGMKALRSINSTFKKLVTQWNPVFIVRNFVRDAQSALYFTHYSNATFIKNYGKAVKEIATNGKYWQLYQAMGGKGTTYYDPKTGLSDRHHFKNGSVDKVAGGLNRVIDILSFANEAVEQYPRLAEFISTMEATGDVQQALYNAADITTNFGRGGFAARKLNASLVPFFNPGMQGLSKNIRNVIDRRGAKEIGQLISRLLLNGVMPGIIMSLVYDGLKEDEDYKELSNYIKDSNILIKIGDDKFIKVPMGREPSVITAFTNRMWRWLKGEPASSAFADYPSFAIEQLAPNNPLTNNIFAGITAMSTNKNWYGGDIVSSYMEEKPDYLQYDESTDAFSIWLGEITRHGKNGIEGLSPKKVNYLIDQYSGFIGDWVLPALSKKADVPAVVKAFVVDSVRQNRLGSDFYDALDEAKQVKETEFATAADDATYSYLYKQSKAASEITKQLKEIYNSGEKTRKEKMSEARDLLELRNEIYRNALLTVGTYEETAKSIDSADSDVVKREANRKAFGAEYALKTYNKDVGEKAAEYVAKGVTYDQYYAAYFAARGITGDKDENGKTITNSASRKKKEAIDKAVPNATTKQKHLLYEAIGVSDKVW